MSAVAAGRRTGSSKCCRRPPPATTRSSKRAVYERAGVREYWLVHPTDRVVTVYTLLDGGYGKPAVYELAGELAAGVLPDVSVAWERVLRET